MSKKQLEYRTFDQLMDEVRIDFRLYENEGLIEPAQLIKVAQRVNYDLGVRIHSTKNVLLKVTGNVLKLPEDFYKINFALACNSYKVIQEIPSGTHREDIILNNGSCKRCGEVDPTCSCEKTYTVCDDVNVKVIQKASDCTIREYNEFSSISFKPGGYLNDTCFKGLKNPKYTAEIRNGYIYFSGLSNCNVYICYEGSLEDEEGNLLVLDHPMINEYYEYAVKQRILENLFISGENVTQKLQLIEERLRTSRNNAKSIVNTPDFREMYEVWKGNRDRMYHRYYNSFKYHL